MNQTYTEFDLFLVDDNSTDGKSGKICDRYSKQDKRVHVIHHNKNCGLSIARENGFYASDSEWVSFIDNDDVIAPDMYEEMLKLVSSNHVDMVCVCGANKTEREMLNLMWEKGRSNISEIQGEEACSKLYADKIKLALVKQMWGKIIRRSLIEKVIPEAAPYRDKLQWVFFEDVLFTPMIFYYADRVVFDDRIMYIHRVAGRTNLSLSIQPHKFHYESVEASIVVLNFFEKKDLMEAYDWQILGCFSNMISVWYKVWKNETDSDKKAKYNQLVDEIFDKYGQKLKAVRNRDISTAIKKMNIALFKWNRNLWGMTAGNFYFDIIQRISY